MNKITINFTTCSPAPSGGYLIYYRTAGSDVYILAGRFYTSPAIFYDTVNPPGTCYEGYVVSDCGNDTLGNHIPFETCGSIPCDNSSCQTSISISTPDLTYKDLGLFDLHVDCAAEVIINYNTYDRPNKFTLYEDGIIIQTTGWKGYAPYPGPWGLSLSTFPSGNLIFIPLPGKVYQLRIEAGPAGPPPYNVSDNFIADIHCN